MLRFRKGRLRKVLGFVRELAKAAATAMQSAFHGGNTDVGDRRDFVERVAEHVHQDHTTALRDREAHEGAEAGCGELTVGGGVHRIENHLGVLIGVERVASDASAQKVQRRIMGDAKNPALQVGYWASVRKRL